MGLLSWLGGDIDYAQPVNTETLGDRTQQSRTGFANRINQLISRGENISGTRLTAKDLFGEQMNRLGDAISSNANATKRALSRSMIAGGGDVSGSLGARILGVNQSTNESLGETALKFGSMANNINRYRQGRADRLLTSGLQGSQNLYSLDNAALQTAISRHIQNESASRERGSSILGGVLGTIGSIGAALFCWCAEEIYGKGDLKVAIVRGKLLEHEGKDDELGRFLDEYKENGRQWAMMVRDDKNVRNHARRMFDSIILMVEHEAKNKR